jgi:hypothetical protein
VLAGVLFVASAGMQAGGAADGGQLPRLHTNEALVDEVNRAGAFDVADVKAVFAFVFNSLPDRVKVYPTENYYYFSFYHRGVRYMGNIRLENELRDQGKVHFAYEIEPADWNGKEQLFHAVLDAAQGLAVEKLDKLVYRLAFGGKEVVFELNDLSAVVPPAGLLAADERYLGPVFDESAIRFFLIYNPKLKIFHYVLDETVAVADRLAAAPMTDRILIGKRTGFAFYRDHKRERKILIGVFEQNARLNTYYDGPFDQLPDNFIEGESLRASILQVDPALTGRIDRYGSAPGGEIRYMIAPYVHYRRVQDLARIHRCAGVAKIPADHYYRCFSVEEDVATPNPARRHSARRPQAKRPGQAPKW